MVSESLSRRKDYQISGKKDSRELAKFLAANGQVMLPDACECVGVSRSSVSGEFVVGSEEELGRLLERRFDDVDIVIIYIDGMVFAGHNVTAALDRHIDQEGKAA